MLGDRQELHVGEASVEDVLGEFVGELAVVEPRPPRAEVHLVDRERTLVLVGLRATLQPGVVAPGVVGGVDHRAGGRRDLRGERERVGLLAPHAVAAEDVELVDGAVADVGDEQLPDAGGAERSHGVRSSP